MNNIKQTIGKQNYDETLFLFKLLNVVLFEKNVPIGKYDARFIFSTNDLENVLIAKLICT